MDQSTLDRLGQLEEKYALMGQDLNAYLDGLLLSNFTPYWDYTMVDTLLTLQRPRTDFPDETIFIIYHQINELYFRLCLHEMHQLAYNGRNIAPTGEDRGWQPALSADLMVERLKRMNNYFGALAKSFDIMVHGMEKEQFLRFRMALLPASGFQSAQYRMVEICATSMYNLVDKDSRAQFSEDDSRLDEMFAHIYWKQGAKETASGQKTLTLKQFEQKYSDRLTALAHEYRDRNMWAKYMGLSEADRQREDLRHQLREFDLNVNIRWPLVHYRSAVRYLSSDKKDVAATGGTNWQQYLPPRLQKRVFYPHLWAENDLAEWGTAPFLERYAPGL